MKILTKAYFEKVITNTKDYFKNLSMRKILLKILLFSNDEITTINLASQSKQKRKKVWYLNNLVFPFFITYCPYIFYLLSIDFGTIQFTKGLAEISLAGGISLLGINVMRISMTLINEKIDETKIPEEIRKSVVDDIETIKSTLRSWIQWMTIIGVLLYVVQVMGLIATKHDHTAYYITGILIVSLISIYLGRLITIIQSNFFDNDNLIKIWIDSLKYKSEESYNDLEKSAKQSL